MQGVNDFFPLILFDYSNGVWIIASLDFMLRCIQRLPAMSGLDSSQFCVAVQAGAIFFE
jgi:hypothetical protein